MTVRETWTADDGYAVLRLIGVVHELQVFTSVGTTRAHPLVVEISGAGTAVATLDQEDINALHEFFGRFATPEKEQS